MQKVLLSVILALVMALALVGMKRAFTPTMSTQGTVMMADGVGPAPIPGSSF